MTTEEKVELEKRMVEDQRRLDAYQQINCRIIWLKERIEHVDTRYTPDVLKEVWVRTWIHEKYPGLATNIKEAIKAQLDLALKADQKALEKL